MMRVESKDAGRHPSMYELTAYDRIMSQMSAVLRLSNLVEFLVSLSALLFSLPIYLFPTDLILEYLSSGLARWLSS